jgi:RNA binding exosome subunit
VREIEIQVDFVGIEIQNLEEENRVFEKLVEQLKAEKMDLIDKLDAKINENNELLRLKESK